MNLTPELREQIKNYIQYIRDNKDEILNKDCDLSHKNPFNLPDFIKKRVDEKFGGVKLEASTSSAVGAYSTPFAFARRGIGNTKAAQMFGFKLAKPLKKESIALVDTNLDKSTYIIDKNGLRQDTPKNQSAPTIHGFDYLQKNEEKLNEIVGNLIDEASKQLKTEAVNMPIAKPRMDVTPNVNPPSFKKQAPNVNPPAFKQPVVKKANNLPPKEPIVKGEYEIQDDFFAFQKRLNNATEEVKDKYQEKIQNAILGKKIVLQAAKGYKQNEQKYTVNVVGVSLDYYYDKYIIVITGREDNAHKMHDFFVNPAYSIRILGPADVRGNDQYDINKSKALVSKSPMLKTAANNVTAR